MNLNSGVLCRLFGCPCPLPPPPPPHTRLNPQRYRGQEGSRSPMRRRSKRASGGLTHPAQSTCTDTFPASSWTFWWYWRGQQTFKRVFETTGEPPHGAQAAALENAALQ